MATADPTVVADNMRVVLRRWFGEPGGAAKLVSAQQQEWSDSCFGAGYPYESCAQTMTPGWELTFDVNGASYVFRTDPQAYRFRLMSAPPQDVSPVVVSWSGDNGAEQGTCVNADIGEHAGALAVAFGDCAGPMVVGTFMNESNRQLLNQHVERFATFKGQTPAGNIYFTGKGKEKASAADQRAIAELAQLMYQEARGGQPAGSWVNALALRRDGVPDRAPICLTVDLTGRAVVTDCAAQAAQPVRLNSGGLEQLYAWVDGLQPFDAQIIDKEITTQLTFAGRGTTEATDADKQAIRTYADGLIAEARDLGAVPGTATASGTLRIALPLMLPDGLDWVPAKSSAGQSEFNARAEDPANPQSRWAEVGGSLAQPASPTDKGTPVQLRGTNGTVYNFGAGHRVIWQEEATHFVVSASFSLSETLEIASSLAPMQLVQFDQLMRERANMPTPTPTPGR
jgi:hypothetical protein